jgi:hypothetical protein
VPEIEYDLTEEDLLAYQRYHRRNPPEPRRGGGPANVVVWVLFVALVVAATLLWNFSDSRTATAYLLVVPYIALGAALALGGVVLYARLMQPRLLLRALRQGQNADKFLGWRRLTIDAEGIHATSEFASSVYLWHGIDRIGQTPDHAFFYINTTMAIVLPRAAFREDAAFKDFVNMARRYYRIGRVGDGRGASGEPPIPTALPAEDGPGASEGIVQKDVRRSFRDPPGA